MAKLSKLNEEILEMLNGCEVRTSLYETEYGVVGVEGNKVIDGGKTIATLNSNKKIKALWKEYCAGEGL
jgi:hypothetical protein